jgi:Skp family chaperone for outer membrane proteins
MKRTAITGLFIAAALLASPVFAAEDLCALNLQKIDDAMATAGATSENMSDNVADQVKEAKAAQAAGNTKDCIAITSKALDSLEKTEKSSSGGSGE